MKNERQNLLLLSQHDLQTYYGLYLCRDLLPEEHGCSSWVC